MTSDQTAVLYWIGFPALVVLVISIAAMRGTGKIKEPKRGGKADRL